MNFLSQIKWCVLSVVFILLISCTASENTISIYFSGNNARVDFAIEEIKSALLEHHLNVENTRVESDADIVIKIQPVYEGLRSEGFALKKENKKIQIIGFDDAGVMYGGLELAEQIKISGIKGVTETVQNSYMELRGTKFNIPLDARTPSYTDASDSAQKNIPEMWNFDFWTEYIDNLARYRYNYISLWNLHPFPSMVKVPEYPDVALDDVQRSTTINSKSRSNLMGIGYDAPEILENPEIVKKITIDEKIAFWKKVMAYAKSRNIDFYILTWNIFVNGTDEKYGITDKIDNVITRDYFRKSIKHMLITYPDLAGIGITAGENMHGSTKIEKEDWIYDTYAQGFLDAAEELPNRKMTFIHRQHMTGAQEISEKFKPLVDHKNIEFLFSFKYAVAHVYSATEQYMHQNFVKDIEGMKTLWTLRNDDVYQYRWGAPNFVREFIENIPYEVSKGFYFGSDGYVWGREFLMKDAESPRQLEVVKHWYHWMLWGRLGYDPELSNERFIAILQNRFPEINANTLFQAWEEASMIYPVTTGFHWGRADYMWYIEACQSTKRMAENNTGFHDVNRFITMPVHPKSGSQSIPYYVKMIVSGGDSKAKSPLKVSQLLHTHADKALQLLDHLNPEQNKELKVTLNDIKTMGYLGKYYAHKIAGATNLALFRATKDEKHQNIAILELEKALAYWEDYTETALNQNINPLWTNRVGVVDFNQTTEWVAHDIEIAKAPLLK